ncbi:integrin alpha-4-like [Achroia grisella]|uniref:integrin alpha-4-like n=1 Tax=Achroia grisella TaxID=688607 RepID=UPI0027D317F2|nr:integrin alpha-4-like [Achroia grisella]
MIGTVYLAVCLYIIDTASCIYYHESSFVTLTAKELKTGSDFGFSMAYQQGEKANIVIGAPNSDRYGKVYNCSLKDPFSSNVTYCNEVNMNFRNLTPYTVTDNNPDQKFMLGASVAATTDYFMACAPLWTGVLPKLKDENVLDKYVYGTCFIYNGTSNRYRGEYEQEKTEPPKRSAQACAGGTGWKILIDDVNNLILISKPSTSPFKGAFVRLKLENPFGATITFPNYKITKLAKFINRFQHFGTSLTAGNFFNKSERVYAVSARNVDMYGEIIFLRYNVTNNKFDTDCVNKTMFKKYREKCSIKDTTVGSMFGAALGAGDLNNDGLTDLLVGAPAQSGDRTVSDTGAVHIYLGNAKKTVDLDRQRTIISNNDGSRFGTTIATNDLDGDGIPEIFVSAPYENSGNGALYIISGYEIYKDLKKHETFKQIFLTKLTLTQRIQNELFRYLGFSIQVLPDLDKNGCDEVVMGAPFSQNAILLRCIPRIQVNITSELHGIKNVREQDNNFTVTVCVNVSYFSKMDHINAQLLVSNDIRGVEASIEKIHRKYTIDLEEKKPRYCENVTVKLNNNEKGDYKFFSKVYMNNTNITNTKEFNKSWVTIHPDSTLEAKVLDIFRFCTGDDCLPQLSMSIIWSGSNETYVVRSAETESITVQVHNSGNSSYKGCMWIYLRGAQVAQINCTNLAGGYICHLPNPLKRNVNHEIYITLNMRMLTNLYEHINTSVRLYSDCPKPFQIDDTESSYETYNKSIPLSFNMDDILCKGSKQNNTITDKEILDKQSESFSATQEYLIINYGVLTWMNITAVITVNQEDYINISGFKAWTESSSCDRDDVDKGLVKCSFNLMPNSTVTLRTTIPIFNNKLIQNLGDSKLIITSNMSLFLHPTTTVMKQRSTTTIIFRKELSLAQDKTAIICGAVLLALLVLLVISYILYKVGFFKRKQKEQLKEHIRRKSIKQSTSSPSEYEAGESIDLDIDLEDDAFTSSSNHLNTCEDIPLPECEERAL